MKSAAAIAFDYRPSRWLQAGVLSAAAIALVAIAASGIPAVAKVIVAAATLLYAAVEVRRLRHPLIQRCAWYADGQWRVRDAGGNDRQATLLDASVRGSLVVLRLRVAEQGRVALVLLPDNCDPDIRRQLAVRLSHAASDVAT